MIAARGWGAVLLLISGLGCQSAQLLTLDGERMTVAIPENSNHWPHFYRDQAAFVMSQQCPEGFEILEEGDWLTMNLRKKVGGEIGRELPYTVKASKTGPEVSYELPGGQVVTEPLPALPAANEGHWRIVFRRKPPTEAGQDDAKPEEAVVVGRTQFDLLPKETAESANKLLLEKKSQDAGLARLWQW